MPGLDLNIEIKNGLALTEIRIWPTRDADVSRIKATASLTFNGVIRANGIRIVEGAKGLFLSYPSEKSLRPENWVSFVHALDRETSDKIEEAVLKRYKFLIQTMGVES